MCNIVALCINFATIMHTLVETRCIILGNYSTYLEPWITISARIKLSTMKYLQWIFEHIESLFRLLAMHSLQKNIKNLYEGFRSGDYLGARNALSGV